MEENIAEAQNDEYYLPFNISNESGRTIIEKKMSFFSLMPFSLKKEDVYKNEKRYFIPVKVMDFNVSGEILLDANNVLREWKEKSEKCKEVNSYEVKYNCFIPYEDVLVLQNNYLTEEIFSSLEPFDVSLLQENCEEDIEKLDSNYIHALSGIKKKIFKDSIKLIKNSDNYSEEKVKMHNLEIQQIDKKKIYLPILQYEFKFNNKEYIIYINGQTGKIVGEFPKSRAKLIFFSAITFIIILIVAFLIAYFL